VPASTTTFTVTTDVVESDLADIKIGQAAAGSITSSGMVALLGFALINYLPVLLSLTMFISVLLTMTRSWRDSEMVIWFGSGITSKVLICALIVFFLIVEPHGLARLWQIAKEKLRLWPFPH